MTGGDLFLLILAVILCSWIAPVIGLFLFVMLTEWWHGEGRS